MKKISYYLFFIILAGLILISFWVQQRFFKKAESPPLLFKVERGDIQEAIRVRGEVVSQKEFDLGFSFSGALDRVYVKEGERVEKDAPLMKLETTDLKLEIRRLETLRNKNQASYDKLLAGPTEEEIKVLETKAANGKIALNDAETNLTNVKNKAEADLANFYQDIKNILNDAYLKADDAVNKQTDEMFSNDFSDRPQLTFNTAAQAEIDVENERIVAGVVLKTFKTEIDNLSDDYSSLEGALTKAENHLTVARDFLAKINDAVNSAIGLSSASAGAYKTNINAARANINTAISNIAKQKQFIADQKIANNNNVFSAQAKVNEAQNALLLTQDELRLKKTPARAEDVEAAKAQIEEIDIQIDIVKDKIKKSSLISPVAAKVVKIWFEEGEIFNPGQAAISLFAPGYKIQSDISELEIGKIREVNGNEVQIKFDAFPVQEFKGKVISVEPKEVVKEGDKYYRVNVVLTQDIELIRPGMSADLIIKTSLKENVLKIPALAVYKKDNKKFVKVLEGEKQKEVEIEAGISDGDSIEVVKGLTEGQTIAVSAD